MERPLILISNDDGYDAKGINDLAEMVRKYGDIIIVAPDSGRSGAALSITCKDPVMVKLIKQEEGLAIYSCSGTPCDCVKMAFEKILPKRPDLVLSGINHGDNASISLHYSGTVGAALEACMKGIPAIAFSLKTCKKECDFSPFTHVIQNWVNKVLEEGLPTDTCLNINFPEVSKLSGSKVCRMARGIWHTEWLEAGKDTEGRSIYTLTGTFNNLEPDAEDTDYWAIDHNMAAITPLKLDMTDNYTLTKFNNQI
jgi:5'-nucleotidase